MLSLTCEKPDVPPHVAVLFRVISEVAIDRPHPLPTSGYSSACSMRCRCRSTRTGYSGSSLGRSPCSERPLLQSPAALAGSTASGRTLCCRIGTSGILAPPARTRLLWSRRNLPLRIPSSEPSLRFDQDAATDRAVRHKAERRKYRRDAAVRGDRHELAAYTSPGAAAATGDGASPSPVSGRSAGAIAMRAVVAVVDVDRAGRPA